MKDLTHRNSHVQPQLTQLLSEFNRSLMLIADKELLLASFISKIRQLFPVKNLYVFLSDENTGNYKVENPGENGFITFEPKDRLIKWLAVNDCELVISENPDIFNYFPPAEQKRLKEMDAELVYPLKVMNHISGMIIASGKTDGNPYTKEDIKLMSLLFNQAAFAIEHASLYESQKERIKKMYRADRLATLGELAAGAAHEIRNPLTSIRSTIQYLSKDFQQDPVKSEMFSEIINEVERINKILQGLLSFARPTQLDISRIDMAFLVNQVLLLLSSSFKKNNIAVLFENTEENSLLRGDAEQLKQVFINIILNAVESMKDNPENSSRTLTISFEKSKKIDLKNRYFILHFLDTGKGISPEDMESIFNPFFTTKDEGTGLGLAICYGIINRHEGEIEISSEPGSGTCVSVKLPQFN